MYTYLVQSCSQSLELFLIISKSGFNTVIDKFVLANSASESIEVRFCVCEYEFRYRIDVKTVLRKRAEKDMAT